MSILTRVGIAFAASILVLLTLSHYVEAKDTDPGQAPASIANSVHVTITEQGLTPAVITVTLGTEVIWYNATATTQTVKSQLSPPISQNIFLPFVANSSGIRTNLMQSAQRELGSQTVAAFFVGILPPGGTFSHIFDQLESISYELSGFTSIQGQIIVQPTNGPTSVCGTLPSGPPPI